MQRSSEEIQRLLEGVGLPKDEDPVVRTLSHCNKRKLSLILALIGNTKVMPIETALSEVWIQVYLLRAHASTHARTHARTDTHTHTHTHTHTQTHTHL